MIPILTRLYLFSFERLGIVCEILGHTEEAKQHFEAATYWSQKDNPLYSTLSSTVFILHTHTHTHTHIHTHNITYSPFHDNDIFH
jgi:hypothetical protein